MTDAERVSLKTYFDQRMDDMQRHFQMRLDALEKATTLAASQLDNRLEGMNEFRAALRDQCATFLSKVEYEAHHGQVVKDVRELRESRAMLAGKADQKSVNVVMVISLIALATAVFQIVLDFVRTKP
jgi:hypothetical protein